MSFASDLPARAVRSIGAVSKNSRTVRNSKSSISREAPRHAAAWLDAMDRRDFLKLMGASLALAGLSGCVSSSPAPPDEKIVPYVKQPEEIIPGKPLYFATAMPLQRFRPRHSGREPYGPADQSGGEPRTSREPRRDRCDHAGIGARSIRSRPLSRDQQRWPDQHLERIFYRAQHRARVAAAEPGSGLADLNRDGDFANAWRTNSECC